MTDPKTSVASPQDPSRNGLDAYQGALRRYADDLLRRVARAIGPWNREPTPRAAPAAIAERLSEPAYASTLLAGLEHAPRLAFGLLGLVEPGTWTVDRLTSALAALGVDPGEAMGPLLDSGLVALAAGGVTSDLDAWRAPEAREAWLIVHPEAIREARTLPPEGAGPPSVARVRLIRQSDGLEPILRLAVLWQRVVEASLRQTQQGELYKRDRERLRDDPALGGPIDDQLTPLNDPATLWLAMARAVGMVAAEPDGDRIVAAGADFWAEHGVHLPHMLAVRWLILDAWQELPSSSADPGPRRDGPALRLPVLLWLATKDPADWVAIDDLVETITRAIGARPAVRRWVEAIALGPAYLLGLVHAAEEDISGRRVVQLSAFGRYVLGLAPAPPPRELFDEFLTVQPNFEVIAYRQGLNPFVIGQLSRFVRWSRLGAALQLELTPEQVYRGLEGGLTPPAMLDRLARHSARPVPPGVAEAVRTWAGRRERVTYHASATLLEFASASERDRALATWTDDDGEAPIAVGDRLVLAADPGSIPFHQFRLLGARDYRQPPDPCVTVEPDGVTLSVDPNRSDLFVVAELTRFADELPPEPAAGAFRRRFRASAGSLSRWRGEGLGPAELSAWFARRTGSELPPALRLLAEIPEPGRGPLRLDGVVILRSTEPGWLDGLAQLPQTAGLLGERIGPAAVEVARRDLPALAEALRALGIAVESSLTEDNAHTYVELETKPRRR